MIKLLKKAYLGLIILFLYAPIAVLIFFSFNESKSRSNFTGFTFKWYIELFHSPNIMTAVYNTLLIAFLSAVFATIIGTLAAIGIHWMDRRLKFVVLKITDIPVLNPDIVTGISLMLLYMFFINFFNSVFHTELNLGFTTILLSHITFNIPYVIISVLPKLRQMDKNIYEAALDLGSSPLYAYYKIIIPEISPGIITGAILAFTLSLDDFVITFFTTGSGVNTISTLVYSMTKQAVNPKINALSTIMFVVVLILLYLINKRDNKNIRKEEFN